jgi:HK97 family phage major capsid protein
MSVAPRFSRFVAMPTLSTRATDDRTIDYVFSDESIARDNHTISTAGWELDSFLQNPVFLWAHDANSPPIGRVVRIGAEGSKLTGSVRYADVDEYLFADTIFRLTKGGYLNAASVSWNPLDWRHTTDRSRPGGIDFLRQELLEISAVPVPALATALVSARAAGIDTKPVADWASRALDLGRTSIPRKELEMFRTAARPPKKMFSGGRVIRRASAAITAAEDPRQIETRRISASRRKTEMQRNPCESFAEFLTIVRHAALGNRPPDPRLVRAPTGAGEVDPTGGGFLVPDAYSDQLIGSLYEEAILAPLCDRRQTDKPNNARLPAIDETSRADGSRWGGTLSYWAAEGVQPNATLPKFKSIVFNASKLIALCVATDELISDVPLLGSHMLRAFAAEASFQLDKSILFGTGAGVPLGIVNAPGTIQVAKRTGQAAATIVSDNIADIWSRLPAPCRKRAVWIINEDAEAQLEQLGATATAGTFPMYFPNGQMGNEFALLKGRPVIVAEQCPTLAAEKQ